MIHRNDLLLESTSEFLEIIQLTTGAVPSSQTGVILNLVSHTLPLILLVPI